MSLPFALFAFGRTMQALGQFKADEAQASAEEQNAGYYVEQEKFMLDEMFRSLDVFDRKASTLKGAQIQHAGAQGTAITGFTLDRLAGESALMASERGAIKRNGEFKARLAGLRATQANDTADALTSSERKSAGVIGLLTSFAGLDL